MGHIGVVVIGRNEGERLKHCLYSILSQAENIVYVDSNSSDRSVDFVKSIGVHVVQLDMSTPFSAGRARNEGFSFLMEKYPQLEYVQFIDGDCELNKEWIAAAEKYLSSNPTFAIVAGRREERYPEQSIYNRLCDIEWNTPIGEAQTCGGDFMVRAAAFQEVAGFNPEVIAGEEPEMCYRLREMSWHIYRLDHLMTKHDAAITHFSQWWKRTLRSGHAYAQGYSLHGMESKKYCLRDSLRIWFWTLIVPCLILILTLHSQWWLILLIAYPVQLTKIAININRRLASWNQSFAYAFFILIGKWPQLNGQFIFLTNKILKNKQTIIEYK